MTKHTPGTWTSELSARSSWVHLGDADDGRVVEVKGDNHQNDADFIAEAPAMLDALRDASAMLDAAKNGRWNWDGSTEGQIKSTLRDVRAILARIEGGAK